MNKLKFKIYVFESTSTSFCFGNYPPRNCSLFFHSDSLKLLTNSIPTSIEPSDFKSYNIYLKEKQILNRIIK